METSSVRLTFGSGFRSLKVLENTVRCFKLNNTLAKEEREQKEQAKRRAGHGVGGTMSSEKNESFQGIYKGKININIINILLH